MPKRKRGGKDVPYDKLRLRIDPQKLPFKTTEELEPLDEIIGQERAVKALRFGVGIKREGYNVVVTGWPGSGRLSLVKKLLKEFSEDQRQTPDDLIYVNNFKDPDSPRLIRLKAGEGREFKKDIKQFVENLKREVPQLFESQEYINRKKQIMEEYEQKGKQFFKELDKQVRSEGFTLVDIQVGQIRRPEVMPLVDGNPVHIDQLEEMVEKGRFPKDEFEKIREKQKRLREEIDQIFIELRELQKEVQRNIEEMDRVMFLKMASELLQPIKERYPYEKVEEYLNQMLEDMAENIQIFTHKASSPMPVSLFNVDPFVAYEVNLLVDNSETKGPPVIIESYPTYRNLFGIIERVVDRTGVWKADFTKIRAGSFLKANGGYLVINLLDALFEPGVWQALKRALKTNRMEIQSFDPFYYFFTSGLKPEPIDIDVKVIVISNPYIYHLLLYYDEDMEKIFKIRADFSTSMDNTSENIYQMARFVKKKVEEENLRPFDRTAIAVLVEEAIRMTGRTEKISTSFPKIANILRESDFWAQQEGSDLVMERHVEKAIEERIYRSNLIEEQIQEMIDRGTLMIDVDGEVVGQVNGLAIYDMGDLTFGKPSRITATTSMGRAGIINIEREADLSGKTHNKGVLILSGYLRKRYAQDKPLTLSASIAFEQSYSGVDGDSASSTELYALLSSLSGVPLKQYIAVTGSVNQKGEIQPIGGVNEKIEGFFDCCKRLGLNGKQGVMIPEANVKDLMLRKDVVDAVKRGKFHIYAVKTIDEGIEILTGKKAGERKKNGTYQKDTINYLVDKRLRELAEGIKSFGEEEEEEKKKKGRKKKTSKKG